MVPSPGVTRYIYNWSKKISRANRLGYLPPVTRYLTGGSHRGQQRGSRASEVYHRSLSGLAVVEQARV